MQGKAMQGKAEKSGKAAQHKAGQGSEDHKSSIRRWMKGQDRARQGSGTQGSAEQKSQDSAWQGRVD